MLKKLLFALAVLFAISSESKAQCVATITGNSTACYGTTTVLQATTGGVSYQWYYYGNLLPGATSDTLLPNYSGDYTVTINFGTCTTTSAIFSFTQGSIFYLTFFNSSTTVCLGDTIYANAAAQGGVGPYSFIWTGPNSFTSSTSTMQIYPAQLTDNGYYIVQCTDNIGCTATDTVWVTVNDCDSVWPGDVNWDMTADNNDALDLALAYGSTGLVRSGGNSWTGQWGATWMSNQASGVNMKHADCNGDGTVDANDTTAIALNYGQTHLKGEHVPQAKSAANPDLYFDLTGINFVAGTTVNIPIKLGTGTIPMNNILGIAADINVSGITLNNAPTIAATTSWMGTTANLLNFTKGVSANQTDWTLARIDQTNVSGNGTIATLTMNIPTGTAGQDAILYFSNVKIIDNNGTTITNYNVVDDTAAITLSLPAAASALQYALVAPNPAQGNASLHISLVEATDINISISDVTGREVAQLSAKAVKGEQQIALPISQLSAGIYNVHLANAKGNLNNNLQMVKK